jgi:outer membrane protein assembly factor BamA
VRLGWNFNSAKSFGYSVSPEEGTHAGVTSELTRRAFGADGDAGALIADLRGYLRAFPRHGVLAARVAGAASWGDDPVRRVFTAGGSGPRSTGFGFDSDAIGLMRGFEEADLVGHRAAVVNLDYRFPLLQVQRGAGTLPVFLRQLHGAIFADLGTAWDTRFSRSDLRRSLGAEISTDWVIGGALPITIAGGAAWRHDPVSAQSKGWAAFGRIGRAF